VEIGRNGYTLTIHGPSIHPTVNEIEQSMKTAEVTLLVGHGSGGTDTSGPSPKWISTQIKLDDGMISSPDGIFKGKWNGGTLDNPQKEGKVAINKVTGIFTCNSTDKLPSAFNLPAGSHLITNDGGADGVTRVGTLELGAAEFVKEYARTKGDVSKAMSKAQVLFTQKGAGYNVDKGDTLSDKVGAPPPAPPTSNPYSGVPTGRGIVNEIPR
jgi:hypothetical protein